MNSPSGGTSTPEYQSDEGSPWTSPEKVNPVLRELVELENEQLEENGRSRAYSNATQDLRKLKIISKRVGHLSNQ